MSSQDEQSSESGSDGGGDHDYDTPSHPYLIDRLKDIEAKIQLHELILSSDDDATAAFPTLAATSLISIIDDDIARNPEEPEKVLMETCRYLVAKLQDFYQREIAGSKFDSTAKSALYQALSKRVPYIPSERSSKLDGCKSVLSVNVTEQVQPETLKKQIIRYLDLQQKFMSIHPSRPTSLEDFYKNEEKSDLSLAMKVLYDFSVDDCLVAFLPDQDQDIDNYISECADEVRGGLSGHEGDVVTCTFAGIVKSLVEYRSNSGVTGNSKDGVERDDDGHIIYEEDEPEMYHGWTGSWQVENDSPEMNSFWYGVKLGTILSHAQAYYRTLTIKTPRSEHSCAYANLHGVLEGEAPTYKPQGEPVNENDVTICRAKYEELDGEIFYSDGTAYSNTWAAQDGKIGFSHVGTGWKNREFKGFLYAFDFGDEERLRGFDSVKLKHEFWSTPYGMHCDGDAGIAWVWGDQRIKGFGLSRVGSVSIAMAKYIFHIDRNPQASHSGSISYATLKRREALCNREAGHGGQNIVVSGNKLCFINKGYVQEWRLDEGNEHSGMRRMVHMASVDQDIEDGGWRAEDIINLSTSTWMDEDGAAEVTRGLRPDCVRPVDFATPSSVGYLPGSRFAFANSSSEGIHFSNGQLTIMDSELRELTRLVGFGSGGVEVVQRPTFEKLGDDSTLVASDESTVKIFDLRTGRAELTIRQRCENSTPVYVGCGKFVCNRLSNGAMLWDLRAQKPLYNLPIQSDVTWIPGDTNGKPPILVSGYDMYKFGRCRDLMSDQEKIWEEENATFKWARCEEKRGGNCSIM